jgi:DNA-binding transcriptional LysR family regulator
MAASLLAAADETPTGAVRVTCSESIGYRLVQSQLLETFHNRHPGMRVELVMSDHFLDIAKGAADVAIRAGIPNEETLVGRKIADVPWALYGSRAYLERNAGIAHEREIGGGFGALADATCDERGTRVVVSNIPADPPRPAARPARQRVFRIHRHGNRTGALCLDGIAGAA